MVGARSCWVPALIALVLLLRGAQSSVPQRAVLNIPLNLRPLDSEPDCSGITVHKAGDRRTDPKVLRIASYNAQWLTDGQGKESELSPWRGDPAGALHHIQEVARELLAIDADVVALEEVEDCPTLALLLDALAEEGDRSYRAYLVPGKDTHMRMNVALLTRVDPVAALYRTEARAAYPVADSSCGLHGRAPQTSGLSRHAVAMLAPEGFPPMALLLLHLKAFPKEAESCAQREAQGAVAQGLLKAAVRGAGVEAIVLGDMNDFSDVYPDAAGNAPRSRVLATLADVDGDGVADLDNVMRLMAQEERWSHWWDRNRDGAIEFPREVAQLDHVLMTPGLFGLVSAVRVDHRSGPTPSDHRPLVVDLAAPA